MIIYECIFNTIIEPFMGMGDDDELVLTVMSYENREDFQGLCNFNERKITEDLKRRNIKYLNSRNIQNTLYYYLKCINRNNLILILNAGLIGFEDVDCFLIPLENIYNQISRNIGHINVDCSEFVEDERFSQDVFKNWEEKLEYLNN